MTRTSMLKPNSGLHHRPQSEPLGHGRRSRSRPARASGVEVAPRKVRPTPLLGTPLLGTLLLVGWLATAGPAPLRGADRHVAPEPQTPADWFGAHIRPSPHLTPEQAVQAFHLPEHFTIELIASEPHIAKPLNIAFDARGRLWLTETVEYPYPAADGQGRDRIKILEDTNGDGNFDTITPFAENLNIPIGLYPYGDGVVCFTIPDLVYLRDTTGDGRCDTTQRLAGPFDTTRDTHGMVNALRRGLDGWLHACHGFNNQSVVAGRDGHRVSLTSGNTFRLRLDGSRLELFTRGQVNPFGQVLDDWGYFYSADCHSLPITQLIRGGCYPSFGRPHDGLGFVPPMMEHLHGSTAICGLALLQGDPWPADMQEHFVSGNVMTSRINRNRLQRRGSTVEAVEMPDLLTSDDPWFRPVDLQLGPDGGLYVADFYNRIIGHYEVPLDHPERDRSSGRIWRIRYSGGPGSEPSQLPQQRPRPLDLSNPAAAVSELLSSNPTRRRLAMDQISDVLGSSTLPQLRALLSNTEASATGRASALWSWVRLTDQLPPQWTEMASSQDPLLRNHALLAASSITSPPSDVRAVLRRELEQLSVDTLGRDGNPARAAAEGLGQLGKVGDLPLMLSRIELVQPHDPILAHTLKIAARDLLTQPTVREAMLAGWGSPATATAPVAIDAPAARLLVDLLLATEQPLPAEPLLSYLEYHQNDSRRLQDVIPRLAIQLQPEELGRFLERIETWLGDQPEWLADLLLHMLTAQQLSGSSAASAPLAALGSRTLSRWLDQLWPAAAALDKQPLVHWQASDGTPWGVEQRRFGAGGELSPVFSSLTRGETYTGVFETAAWPCPDRLRFWIVGHNDHPEVAQQPLNRVELVLEESAEVLKVELPPRSDIARAVEWDLSAWRGEPVRLRVIDQQSGAAYAWIGVGGFSLEGLGPGPLRQAHLRMLELAKRLPISPQLPALGRWIEHGRLDATWQLNWWAASQRQADPLLAALVGFAAERQWSDLRELIAEQATGRPEPELHRRLATALAGRATAREQAELTRLLANRAAWHPLLLSLIESGTLASSNLATLDAPWWETLPAGAVQDRLRDWHSDRSGASDPRAADAEMATLLARRLAAIETLAVDAQRGQQIFGQRCAACHRLDGVGQVVGPQLEGVGGRSIERLIEDVLWPDRNVDEAFRTSTVLLEDGEVISGLVRQRTEQVLVMADQEGRERGISVESIVQEKTGQRSLMPGNYDELLGDQELADLLGYLRRTARRHNP